MRKPEEYAHRVPAGAVIVDNILLRNIALPQSLSESIANVQRQRQDPRRVPARQYDAQHADEHAAVAMRLKMGKGVCLSNEERLCALRALGSRIDQARQETEFGEARLRYLVLIADRIAVWTKPVEKGQTGTRDAARLEETETNAGHSFNLILITKNLERFIDESVGDERKVIQEIYAFAVVAACAFGIAKIVEEDEEE